MKTFLRITKATRRLTALAMLSLEKKPTSTIPDFFDQVIDMFDNKKDRIINLTLKPVLVHVPMYVNNRLQYTVDSLEYKL